MFFFSEYGCMHDLQNVRRLPPPALSGLQGQQEIRAQEPLHHRIRCTQMHELRRSRFGAVQRVLMKSERGPHMINNNSTVIRWINFCFNCCGEVGKLRVQVFSFRFCNRSKTKRKLFYLFYIGFNVESVVWKWGIINFCEYMPPWVF